MAHVPVLLKEIIKYANLGDGKRFVDATLDGGGHTRAISEQYGDAIKILAIEYDPVEVEEFKTTNVELLPHITLVHDSYVNLPVIVKQYNFPPDAIVMDLGLSSWHYEKSHRGFTFQKDELLDMRFNPDANDLTAAIIINTWTQQEIQEILEKYGEEQFAVEISMAIVNRRQSGPLVTTTDLVSVIQDTVPNWYRHRKIHCATKTFQALRLTVNDELNTVEQGVRAAIEVLAPGGRLLVISFHGLEDKIVREIFKEKTKTGVIRWVTRDTIKPTWSEIQANPRSRSAKMKIIEKL